MSEAKINVEFDEIKISDNFFCDQFYVCTVQLRTPFWNDAFIGKKDNKNYIGWKESKLDERKNKIEIILTEIKNKYIDVGINTKIIILPEYSIEKCLIKFFQEFTMKNDIMIIAGDYDQDERSNYAQIIYN